MRQQIEVLYQTEKGAGTVRTFEPGYEKLIESLDKCLEGLRRRKLTARVLLVSYDLVDSKHGKRSTRINEEVIGGVVYHQAGKWNAWYDRGKLN